MNNYRPKHRLIASRCRFTPAYLIIKNSKIAAAGSLLAALLFSLYCPPPGLAANSLEPRIIGGQNTTHSQHPYMVSFVERSEPMAIWGHFCGGTLIAPRWVLTAGHCLPGVTNKNTDVVIGRSDLRKFGGERIAIAGAWRHPQYLYNDDTLQYDFGLVYLRNRSQFGKPIAVAGPPPDEALLGVSGWGLSRYSQPAILQSAEIRKRSDEFCQTTFYSFFHQPSAFCTYSVNKGSEQITDICIGDSGGPAIYQQRLVGVASYTSRCWGLSGFAKASIALPWVQEKMSQPPAIQPGRAYQAGAERRTPPPNPVVSNAFIQSSADPVNPGQFIQQFSFQTNLPAESFQIRATGGVNEVCIYPSDGGPLTCHGRSQYFAIDSWAGNVFWETGGYADGRCPVYQYRFKYKDKYYYDKYEPCRPHAN